MFSGRLLYYTRHCVCALSVIPIPLLQRSVALYNFNAYLMSFIVNYNSDFLHGLQLFLPRDIYDIYEDIYEAETFVQILYLLLNIFYLTTRAIFFFFMTFNLIANWLLIIYLFLATLLSCNICDSSKYPHVG